MQIDFVRITFILGLLFEYSLMNIHADILSPKEINETADIKIQ